MSISEKVLNEVLDKIKNMSVDDYTKYLDSYYNSKIQATVIDKVLSYVEEHRFLETDDVLYFPEKYTTFFTKEECCDAFSYIQEFVVKNNIKKHIDKDNPFYNYSCYFKYKKVKYEFWLMSGQGTVCELSLYEGRKKCVDLYVDENIKFHK